MGSNSIFSRNCRTLMSAAKSAAATSSPKAAKKTAATSAPKEVTKKAAAIKGRTSGILKMQTVSPALAQFIGAPETSRSDAVKKIWEYVKANNLQNPDNKREIFCDDKLKTIFDNNDKVNFPGVAKLLSNHFPKAA